MANRTKILIIAGVAILLVALLYFFGGGKSNTYVSDNWSESYNPEEQGPYGTYVLKELLDTAGLFGDFIELDDELENVLENDPDVNDIYFFVGLENYLERKDVDYLLDFVQQGNSAFIASETFPRELLRGVCTDRMKFYSKINNFDSIQYFKFTHPDIANQRYKFEAIYENEIELREWVYMNKSSFINDEFQSSKVLGVNTKERVNFVKISYGEGEIFLHTNPYLFANICLMKRDGFVYAEKILEHIPPGRVHWDKYSLSQHYGESDGGSSGEDKRSMVEFLLKSPTLIWALCILLIGALLYALFKGKRMQRIIPAAESKENTSMRYINTLSSLYLQENKHNKLIQLKEKTFLNFIAEKYYIITKDADDKFITKVSVKSQVPEENIKEIFKLFKNLDMIDSVSDESLILLHKKIENFYKKCR